MYDILLIALASALAVSIGTANAAVTMAPSYGARVARRRILLPLAGLSIIMGAILVGHNVMHTVGKGLIPQETLLLPQVPLAFFINSFFFITLSNVFHIPISTTEIVVLSIAGIGIAFDTLNTGKLLKILIWWTLTPVLMILIAYLFEKKVYFYLVDVIAKIKDNTKIVLLVKVFTVCMGMYFAFSAGANNAANSFGIIVGKGTLSLGKGLLFAGVFMASGAVLFARNIVKSVGEKITYLGLLRASVLEFFEATFLLIASLLGIPVSVNQTITGGMIGIEMARKGVKKALVENNFIQRILVFWILSPLTSMLTVIGILKIVEKIVR